MLYGFDSVPHSNCSNLVGRLTTFTMIDYENHLCNKHIFSLCKILKKLVWLAITISEEEMIRTLWFHKTNQQFASLFVLVRNWFEQSR